jgi:hypothetical protein
MPGLLLALAIAGQPGAAWLPVHEDQEATTSINSRAIGRAGEHRTVAVRTMFRDAAAGGFIHDLELDCAASRLRTVHETILGGRGERVTDGPSLSPEWMTPPEGAPFRAVLTRVCSPAD